MTQEEKAKAYDIALARAKEYLTPNTPECVDTLGVITNIFPELAESEDEKIRRWLIAQLEIKSGSNDVVLENRIVEALAWLEKQGEQEKEIRGKEEKISPKQTQETVVEKLNEIIEKLGDIHEVLSKPCVFPYRDYAPPQEPWYEIQQKTHGVERVPPVTCETTNEVKAEDGKDV